MKHIFHKVIIRHYDFLKIIPVISLVLLLSNKEMNAQNDLDVIRKMKPT